MGEDWNLGWTKYPSQLNQGFNQGCILYSLGGCSGHVSRSVVLKPDSVAKYENNGFNFTVIHGLGDPNFNNVFLL